VTVGREQPRSVFSFYGDDLTGSTDALESLAANGVSAVLFLRPPEPEDLCQFAGCRAIGIAGESRSRSPEWMRRELPRIFHRLREIGAPVVQYKVCSTFDSSPETGSIGCAIDIGRDVFANESVSVVPAAPLLGRYVVFGNLFAGAGDGVYRIDRHPSMSLHPITPMDEGDLLVHLARQTASQVTGVNLLQLRSNEFAWPSNSGAVVFDGLEPADMAQSAQRICGRRAAPQTFVVGSSGFTYGLMDYWRAQGCLPAGNAAEAQAFRSQGRLLVLAGSCSPATERQIRHALRCGFYGVKLDPADFDAGGAVEQLRSGRSVILYSALGHADRVEIADRPALAFAMGRLLREVILASGVNRVVVAGGDTASYATRELGISALTFTATLVRGAPLCRAYGWPGELEMVLKGGQIGPENFFEQVLTYGEEA